MSRATLFSKVVRTSFLVCLGIAVSTFAHVVIDNGQDGTRFTGTWEVSGGTSPYGADSVWARNGVTYTWTLPAGQEGRYEVLMWWSGWNSRTTSAAVDITHDGGVSRVNVNQRANAGQWNSLGTFDFSGGGSVTIIASSGGTISTCADAVMFKTAILVPDLVIDNGQAGTSSTGTWEASGGTSPYGADSLWARNGATYTWSLSPEQAGSYEVLMWWSGWSSRTTSAAVDITRDDGTSRVYVDQSRNAGQWNSLGTFNFSTGGSVSIIAASGATVSTCADAVMFRGATSNQIPIAYIDSISPNPANVGDVIDFVGHGEDDGTIVAHQWTSSIDGILSNSNSFSRSTLSAGNHTISYMVMDSRNAWSAAATMSITINDGGSTAGAENVYACEIYSWNNRFLPEMTNMLNRIGAKSSNGGERWTYHNSAQNKDYVIQYVRSKDDFLAALRENNSHVITGGHSNYGLAAGCVTQSEMGSKKITSIRYADDPKFAIFGSDMVSIKIDGMLYGQQYPNWRPVFQDGSSAMAPYTPSEGLPPYNYYLTYRPPGETNYYRIEFEVSRENMQRFADTKCPAWFSASGAKPNIQSNPEYFVMYPYDQWSRCTYTGTWTMRSLTSTYQGEGSSYGYNYADHAAGTGANKATFEAMVFMPGRYAVSASWITQSSNATNAKYVIAHADGTTTVAVNQRTGVDGLNPLGTFNFAKGVNTITLSDNANGRVIADAVLLTPVSTPAIPLQAEFTVSGQTGSAPRSVKFTNYSTVSGLKSYLWDFGDGGTSTSISPTHVYTSAGVYTVSLRVTDADNNTDTETKTDIVRVGSNDTSIDAEFTVQTRRQLTGGRMTVNFVNLTAGNATSWLWDFGDGTTSTLKNPTKVYYMPGYYTVKLTASGGSGSNTTTEQDYIQILAIPVYVDNAFTYKPHYLTGSSRPSNKNILDMSDHRVDSSQFRYKRLFYGTCNSAQYYLDTFRRGIVFCTLGDVYDYTGVQYLENYMKGVSDSDNVARLNLIADVHDYVNFNLKPPSER